MQTRPAPCPHARVSVVRRRVVLPTGQLGQVVRCRSCGIELVKVLDGTLGGPPVFQSTTRAAE